MARKHRVKVIKAFSHTIKHGNLMINGEEQHGTARPDTVSEYKVGDEHSFSNKKDAQAFIQFHGHDKLVLMTEV